MYTGAPIPRLEDRRFVTGRGSYVDDVVMPGAAHAVFLRSPHASAEVRSIGADAARAMPGVLAVLTGEDWLRAGHGHFIVWSPVRSTDGVERRNMTQPILAVDRVSYVGQPVVLVVAETLLQALDAAEAVEVDYTPLPAITETRCALDPDAPLVHGGAESNLIFVAEVGDRSATQAAFEGAAHVTSLTLTNNRITANPMEPRAVVAHYDPARDHFTIWASHQAPHILRRDLAENTLRHPEHRIRVIAPDVGGGFGMKVANHSEEPAVAFASKAVGRPVRWVATRSESLIGDAQARDHWTTCRMAFDKTGRILAIEADTIASLGAFQTRMGASIPANFYARSIVGLYRTPAAWCRVRGVHTNAPPVQAYRGAGRPEANYVLESLLENGARELGIDVCEIRSRNLLQKEDFPYAMPLGLVYDSADPPGLLRKATALFRYDEMRDEQARRRARGEIFGIGAACFMDCVGTPSRQMAGFGRKKVGGWDSATVRIHPSGKVTVLAGSHSHGQGHATTFAQLCADRLGCRIEDIEIVEGDTDRVQFGHGTWGSRSTVTTGLAVVKAADALAEKCRLIAAHLLDCAEEDILFSQQVYVAAGTNRSVTFGEVVEAAYQGGGLPEGMEPSLDRTAFHDPSERSCSSGFHLCSVTVEPDTWRVRIHRYAAIDDCGRVINPLIVEGQAHGGIVQGIGQALMEDCTFDHGSGQPLSGSFMDYSMPRAGDVPLFLTDIQETLSPSNPIGVKGAGESGTIGALGAVRNAVVDALWHLGVRHIDMPMTPARVWDAVRKAQVQAGRAAA